MLDLDDEYLTAPVSQRDYSILDHWHHCQMDFREGRGFNILKWLDTAPGGRYYWTLSGNVWFEREEDMTLFLLTWR